MQVPWEASDNPVLELEVGTDIDFADEAMGVHVLGRVETAGDVGWGRPRERWVRSQAWTSSFHCLEVLDLVVPWQGCSFVGVG